MKKNIKELPEKFRPPEWLTDVVPRKAPYVPQMGDEIVYFRQGHLQYINAVKRRQIYDIDVNKSGPWNRNPNMRVSGSVHDDSVHMPSGGLSSSSTADFSDFRYCWSPGNSTNLAFSYQIK